MNVYLDEDTASPLLTRLLRRAGHDVQVPADVGMRGASDPAALTHAVRAARVVITHNYDDFEELHDLVRETQGHHTGILVVRRDREPKRNMSPRGIVRAIANLE